MTVGIIGQSFVVCGQRREGVEMPRIVQVGADMGDSRVRGLNHITLSVSDLHRAVAFYRDLLGFRLRALWNDGAYLDAGSLWLCLALETHEDTNPPRDYTHIALDVDAKDFDALQQEIRGAARLWKQNKSEGASIYFLDPDGHKLELHVGSLASRLEHYLTTSAPGITIFDH